MELAGKGVEVAASRLELKTMRKTHLTICRLLETYHRCSARSKAIRVSATTRSAGEAKEVFAGIGNVGAI